MLRSNKILPGPAPRIARQVAGLPDGRQREEREDNRVERLRPERAKRRRLKSPVKMGRSLPTSSRLRSMPPIEMLKGAPEARRRIGDNRSLPSVGGVSNVPDKTKRWRRSSKLRERSLRKSADTERIRSVDDAVVHQPARACRRRGKRSPGPFLLRRKRLRSSSVRP